MKSNKKPEIWMSFLSAHSWNDAEMWDRYLKAAEIILDDKLVKLDENDPVRRKADTESGEGSYITNFEKPGASKMVFGTFAKTKIRFSIWHYESKEDFWGRPTQNSISFHGIPGDLEVEKLYNLFLCSIENLNPFDGYCDFLDEIKMKKSYDGGGIDISAELVGIFWLTFFGKHHADFFTREKLSLIPGYADGPLKGVTLRLAKSPYDVKEGARREAECLLDERLFAGFEPITDFNKRKIPGTLPTLEQLR